MDISGAEDINNLKNYLGMIEGIVDIRVLPSDSLIHVEYDSNTVGVRHILKTVEVYEMYMCTCYVYIICIREKTLPGHHC